MGIHEEQERPYVTWPKRKDQVTFSEIAILVIWSIFGLVGLVATICNLIW